MNQSSRRLRRSATVLVLIAMMSVLVGCGIAGQRAEQPAIERVTAVLQALSESGGNSKHVSAQTAVCQWARGVVIINDLGELSAASNQFTVWANRKQIFRKIASFKVTGAEAVAGSSDVIVSVDIEGRPMKIRVSPNAPLQWVD